MLNFADEQAAADGVHRPRRDIDAVPFFHGNEVEQRQDLSRIESFFQLLLVDLFLEAAIDARALVCLDDIPHFALAVLPFVGERIFVRGVNLHGKIAACVDELDENGEKLELLARLSLIDRHMRQHFAERHARIFAVFDDAHAVVMAGKLPALGDDVALGRLVPAALQSLSAPDIILSRGTQFHRIYHLFLPPFPIKV